ncbi:hypothetical protein PIB30_057157 [Stylosanthes scabra]|uniref:Secreted protein n=1 Tax=Stylosanthes scabra TaxID=79078 RepID=A0ABU6XKL4_9FABA|nr:hypothetical protein [Stylosanthes scabra]
MSTMMLMHQSTPSTSVRLELSLSLFVIGAEPGTSLARQRQAPVATIPLQTRGKHHCGVRHNLAVRLVLHHSTEVLGSRLLPTRFHGYTSTARFSSTVGMPSPWLSSDHLHCSKGNIVY